MKQMKLPFLALVLCLSPLLSAAPLTLKLGSQAPENSPIGRGLIKLAAEWKKASEGQVILKIYHGGSLGDDESLRQKMKTGLIDAGLFTSQAMASIIPEFMSLSAPSLFETQEEFNYALEILKPELEKKLNEKGYSSIAISPGGWVRFFSRYAIASPEDLKKYRMAIDPYESSLIQLFKLLGMNVFPVPNTILLQNVQSKAIDTFYTSPVYFSYQWSSYSKSISYMSDVRIAPFLGCVIVKTQSWEKVPSRYRAPLLELSARIAKEMEVEMIAKENSIIKELSGYGLKVVTPNAREAGLWKEAFSAAVDNEKVELFPRDMVRKARKAVQDYRASLPKP